MKTITIWTIIVVVLLAVAAAIFPNAKAFFKQSYTGVDDEFGGLLKDKTLVGEARSELNAHVEYLRGKYITVAATKETLGKREGDLQAKQQEYDRKKAIVQKASEWLNTHTPADMLTMGGIQYSYANVAADAKAKVDECNQLVVVINSLDKALKQSNVAVKNAEKDIADSLVNIQNKIGELDAKEAQLAALRSVKETMEITKGINIDSGSIEEVSTHFTAQLDAKISELTNSLAFDELASKTNTGIPWDEPEAGVTTASDLAAIQSFLGTKPAPAPAPADSGKPDLSGLLKEVPAPAPSAAPAAEVPAAPATATS